MKHNLINDIYIDRISNAEAAATTDITSSAVDMQGYDGCLFIVHFGTITSGAVTTIKLQQSSDDAVADAYTDLAGTSVTVADTDDNKIGYIDIYKPRERYLKLIVDRGTQNAVVDAITAVKYRKNGAYPITQSSDVIAGEIHISPAEGTA